MQFNRTFTGENDDKDLLSKLLDERADVIDWARIGYQRVKASGKIKNGLSYDDIKNAEDSSLTVDFIEEAAIEPPKSPGQTRYIPLSALYRVFLLWCGKRGVDKSEVPTKQRFRADMVFFGYAYSRLPRSHSPNRDFGFTISAVHSESLLSKHVLRHREK